MTCLAVLVDAEHNRLAPERRNVAKGQTCEVGMADAARWQRGQQIGGPAQDPASPGQLFPADERHQSQAQQVPTEDPQSRSGTPH